MNMINIDNKKEYNLYDDTELFVLIYRHYTPFLFSSLTLIKKRKRTKLKRTVMSIR